MHRLKKWWLKCFIVVASSLTILAIGAWITWPEKTLSRFTKLIQDGEFEEAYAMLHPETEKLYVIDDRALSLAADGRLKAKPRTLQDLILGRSRHSVWIVYANDHSITVQNGSIILGSSYFIYLR